MFHRISPDPPLSSVASGKRAKFGSAFFLLFFFQWEKAKSGGVPLFAVGSFSSLLRCEKGSHLFLLSPLLSRRV